jgi:hypothetical protein
MKQETIEEAAEREYPFNDGFQVMDIDISEELQVAFANGAKWQMERMYSEEEVLEMLNHFGNEEYIKQWFEQFKKK